MSDSSENPTKRREQEKHIPEIIYLFQLKNDTRIEISVNGDRVELFNFRMETERIKKTEEDTFRDAFRAPEARVHQTTDLVCTAIVPGQDRDGNTVDKEGREIRLERKMKIRQSLSNGRGEGLYIYSYRKKDFVSLRNVEIKIEAAKNLGEDNLTPAIREMEKTFKEKGVQVDLLDTPADEVGESDIFVSPVRIRPEGIEVVKNGAVYENQGDLVSVHNRMRAEAVALINFIDGLNNETKWRGKNFPFTLDELTKFVAVFNRYVQGSGNNRSPMQYLQFKEVQFGLPTPNPFVPGCVRYYKLSCSYYRNNNRLAGVFLEDVDVSRLKRD